MENYEVIIVGGGLLGKTAAFELAQSGLIVACIYQRSRTRGQESSAAGGMLGIFSEVTAQDVDERRRLEVEHRWQARLLYQEWIESLHDFTDLPIYLQEGLFVIANAEGIEDAAQFRAIREAATWCGSRAEAVPVRQVPGLVPGVPAFDAMFLPDEGSVDTGQLLTALDEALAKHPRVTVVDARATCISMDSGPGLSVQTTSDTLNGQFVLLAGGAEISQLLAASALSHLEVPVMFSGRGVILLISSATHLPYAVRTPNRGFACGLHVVPRSGEQIYLGATNRLSTTPDFEQQATLSEIKGVSKGECLEERGGVK